MARLKSVFAWSQNTNNSLEYCLREDGVLFIREGYFNDRYNHWAQTKWEKADTYWIEEMPEILECKESLRFGFHLYTGTEATRYRLPQD